MPYIIASHGSRGYNGLGEVRPVSDHVYRTHS